jgi:medium-chain acyl-[acyl-carrier-protein] hydrolase
MMDKDWIVWPRKNDSAAMRLFCFPYAGVGASAYRSWVEAAGPELELGLVQYPGRENRLREQPFSHIGNLVSALIDGITASIDRPFAFYGHSLGGRIAFEVVRELRRRGQDLPSCLFVGASHAPQLPWPYSPLHELEEDAFLAGIQNRYGGVPRAILDDPELRALLIPTLRADVQLLETYIYTPEPPLACDIAVFGGTEDHTVPGSALEAWRKQTSRAFSLRILPGTHFFLQPERQALISAIAAQLRLNSVALSGAR